MSKAARYAIDLGTTNTVIAEASKNIVKLIESKVVPIQQRTDEYNNERKEYLSSTLFFDQNGSVIVGEYAKNMKGSQPDRILYNTKLKMGTDATWRMTDKDFTAKQSAAEILKVCRQTIETRLRHEKTLPAITITVPASFNIDQINDTIDSAVQAGFDYNKITILDEPTAAIIEFVNSQVNLATSHREIDFSEKKRILVFDLGGGTCDVCVVDVVLLDSVEGKIDIEQIKVGRYNEFGGSHFDVKCATDLFNAICREKGIEESELDKKVKDRMLHLLVKFSEEAKEWFSQELEYSDREDVPPYKKNIPLFKNEMFPVTIDVKTYDKYTEDLYIKKRSKFSRDRLSIEEVIKHTIYEGKIETSTIDYVFLTGGMAQYPKVEEVVKSLIQKPVIRPNEMMSAVARGAAISMFYEHDVKQIPSDPYIIDSKSDIDYEALEREEAKSTASVQEQEASDSLSFDRGLKLNTKLAEAIMIDVDDNLPLEIVPSNTTLPFNKIYPNSFTVASPSAIRLDLFAGKNNMDSEMRIQRSYMKILDKPVKIGTPIDIEVSIDKNKYLKLSVQIKDSFHEPIVLDVTSDAKEEEGEVSGVK
ncbi:Hsp70 family protein [Evansella tamaricis]|uniref:Hsp70 family protein n=1 Tax=Evansella tamaricis TaxID=2069301 RepID=A0ABS6JJI7_9BACI|nr:Hsp70 family protein [Evansella tamaricis]MBU9713854.1 Hsp70 family protein [Evansella tamaricis]